MIKYYEGIMTTESLRSIKYSEGEGKKLDLLALKLGRSKRLVFLQMIDYFHRTKKDPLDINDELLKNTLLKQHKDYIRFIKTQENDLLIPTKREVDRMIESQKKVIAAFNSLLKQNEAIPIALDQHNQYLSHLEKGNKRIQAMLADKEQLKLLFLSIFDAFAASRDNISSLGSRKEKEQLLLNTRNQIKNL
jgi:hypothetical protein